MSCVGPEAMVERLRGVEAVTGSARVGQRGWVRNEGERKGEDRVERKEGGISGRAPGEEEERWRGRE
jgi:hypothetical protein